MQKKKFSRFQILLMAEFLFALLLFAGCFVKDKPIYTIFGEDIREMTQETGDGGKEFCGDLLELEPGVYEIQVLMQAPEDASVFVMMESNQVYYKALRNNGMTVLSGQSGGSFRVYALDKIPEAYVYCIFDGMDTAVLRQLTVYKTSLGTRMLLVTVLAFFSVLDFMLLFRRRILEGSVTKKQQVVFWTLTAAVFLAHFPYWTDYFSFGADTGYHLGRMAFLKDALLQGERFPVRMQGTWLSGHGYATSLFYGDLFLYIAAGLQIVGFSILTSYKVFVFLVTAATAVIAYYSIFRCVKEEYAALFGSVVYLLVPYRIHNVYNRMALGEFLAMAFMPLVCCGVYLLFTEDASSKEYRHCKWYIVWGMSGILQSHLITTEMTAILMGAACAIYWRKTFRKKTFVQLLQTVGLVLGINAWFWVPMLYMLGTDAWNLTSVTQEPGQARGMKLPGFLQLLPNRGSYSIELWHWEPVQVGAGAMFLLLLFCVWRVQRRKKLGATGVFAGFCGATLLMCTSYLPWDAAMQLPVLGAIIGSLQFPTRWMAPACVFAAMFAAFFSLKVWSEGGIRLRIGVGISVLTVVFSAAYQVNGIAMESPPVYLYNMENMGNSSVVCGEYLLEGTKVAEVDYHAPVAEGGLYWSDYEKEGAKIAIAVQNDTEATRILELPLFGYRGYGVSELAGNAGEVGLPTIDQARGAHGDLRIMVPGGYSGRLQIAYQGFLLFHIAEAVSAGTTISVIGFAVYQRRKRRHEE